jgi:GntR family transcriptional regulator
VCSAEEVPAPPRVASALGLGPGAAVARIRRVRLGDDAPVALEDSFVPSGLFPGIARRDLTGSLYQLMRDEYGREPVRAVERLEPVLASGGDAKALEVGQGAALMLVERTAWDAEECPVEFARDLHRGDRARFVVEVSPAPVHG